MSASKTITENSKTQNSLKNGNKNEIIRIPHSGLLKMKIVYSINNKNSIMEVAGNMIENKPQIKPIKNAVEKALNALRNTLL